MGTAGIIGLQFYEDLGDSPIAQLFGIPSDIGLPGVSVAVPYTAAGYPEDPSPYRERNALGEFAFAVSPIQGMDAAKANRQIRSLFRRSN